MSGNFILPDFNKAFFIRLAVVVLVSLLFFGLICRPCVIHGESMEPTYGSIGFTFCWCPAFYFRKPRRGQVVIIKYVGRKMLLLKRVVALEGDKVEFRKGVLLVNGEPFKGNWQEKGPCDWELEERTVEPGNVYVVGDNRSVGIDEHIFGQVPASRVIGVPVW